jgi:hypothetical protein
MKASELRQILLHVRDEDEVLVYNRLPYATIGGTPAVPVKSVFSGFDWDSGRLIIYPETDMVVTDKQAATVTMELQRKCDHLLLENGRLKREITKLKKEKK